MPMIDVFYGSGPCPLLGDIGFMAPSSKQKKNLHYKNFACSVLIKNSDFIPTPKKQSGIISKATQVPHVRVTGPLKAVGIQQTWELRAWTQDPEGTAAHHCSLLPQVRNHQFHTDFVCLDSNCYQRAGLHTLGTSALFLKAR